MSQVKNYYYYYYYFFIFLVFFFYYFYNYLFLFFINLFNFLIFFFLDIPEIPVFPCRSYCNTSGDINEYCNLGVCDCKYGWQRSLATGLCSEISESDGILGFCECVNYPCGGGCDGSDPNMVCVFDQQNEIGICTCNADSYYDTNQYICITKAPPMTNYLPILSCAIYGDPHFR